jgi:hypothetical protein
VILMSEYLMKDGSFFVVSGLREAGVSLPEWLLCGVGNFVSCLLLRRNVNLMDLSEALPRPIVKAAHRYQYLERILKEEQLDEFLVMRSLSKSLFLQATANNQVAVISLDQSQIRDIAVSPA